MSARINALERRIEALDGLSREELIRKWHKLYGSQPYKGARNGTLIRGVAHGIQVRAVGGLKPATSKVLLKIAKGGGMQLTKAHSKPAIKVGTRMIREWNGRSYEIMKTDQGFVMNGITHPSLSACAKAITGAHWSGPRFFGVAS